MGLFRPVHDEYSGACFEIYLLHFCTHSGMTDEPTLPQARSALEQHWTAHPAYFRSSNLGKQLRTVKKQLYRARNQIAREAGFREWSSRELSEYALLQHKTNTFGVTGDSFPDWVVRRKVELLEQVSILEVCNELGIDLFDEAV